MLHALCCAWLLPWVTGGHAVRAVLCCAVGHRWALTTVRACLLDADWSEELLGHELCEEVSTRKYSRAGATFL